MLQLKIIIIISSTQIIYPVSESTPEVDSCYISNMINFESVSDPGFESWYKFTLINPDPDSYPGPDSSYD